MLKLVYTHIFHFVYSFAGKGLDTYLAILIPVGIIGNFFSFMVKYFHFFITVIMLIFNSVYEHMLASDMYLKKHLVRVLSAILVVNNMEAAPHTNEIKTGREIGYKTGANVAAGKRLLSPK